MDKEKENIKIKELITSDDLSGLLSDLETSDVKGKDEVWTRVFSEMVPKRKRMNFPLLSRVVASIVLLIGLTYGIYDATIENRYITVETAELLSPEEHILPDGTIVLLSSNSTLVYPKEFAEDKRDVEFEGLAYFSVSKDKTRPFTILAPESKVRVLGTSFSVRAYKGDISEEVFLEEGSVSLSSNKSEIMLVPGEIASVNTASNKISKSVNLNKNITAWKSRELIFDNDPMDYVFTELERYYGKSFLVKDREILALRFNGQFKDLSIDAMLEVLTYTLDFSYTVNDENIVLTNNK